MAVYVIADIEITDAVGFEAYRVGVSPTIAAHGGRYLARGGDTELLEGGWLPKRCVILEFPDMVHFRAWWASPEYQPLRELRERSTHSKLIVTQGL